jgi:Ca2+-binding EF-hand superfamily protein
MLWLKRNTHFNEIITCKISQDKILYGDWYYEDDDDGLIVKASVYRTLKDNMILDTFDYTKLNNATSQEEYRKLLLQYEREINTQGLFEREIAQGSGY